MRKFYLLSVLFLLALSVQGQKLPFQGKLIEEGVPVNGTRAITVSIPALEWSETHNEVAITDGLYFIVLGSTNPIPGNIFDGTDERQMEISVGNVALSPVTLYKPIPSPSVGIDSRGAGSSRLYATLLSQNRDLPFVGLFGLTPEANSQRVSMGINNYEVSGSTVEDGYMSITSNGGTRMVLNPGGFGVSHNNQPMSGFGSEGLWFRNGSVFNAQMMSQNWGNLGYSGTILLRGPNSTNFEIGSRHWENPDMPRINMLGSTSNQIIELTGAQYQGNDGGREKGVILLHDSDGNKSSMTPHHFSVNGPDWKEYVLVKGTNEGDNSHGGNITLSGEDNTRTLVDQRGIFLITPENQHSAEMNGNGNAGNLYLNGPDSENIYLGNKSQENPNLPYFVMKGTENNVITEMSASNDIHENGYFNLFSKDGVSSRINAGYITLTSQDENRAVIGPDGLALSNATWQRGLTLRSTNYNSSLLQGMMEIFGANSPEPFKRTGVLSTQDWGNGDFGMLTLHGSHAQTGFFDISNTERINLGLVGADGETGRLVLSGTNPHVALDDASGQSRVYMQTTVGEGGSSGHFELKGPNSTNFSIGSKTWEDADIPWFEMLGKDNEVKINMSSWPDEESERGTLTLASSTGETTTLTSFGTYGSGPFKMVTGAEVNGTLTVNGDIEGSGTNSYNSDERLKKEIQPLSGNTLNKIESLGGYSYFWKQEEYPEKNFSADQQIGLLAQELEAQFPALVKTGSDGFKSVNYNGFTAVLLQAVKELNHKVEALEKENRLLKDELVASSASQKEMNELKSQIEVLARLVQVKIDASGDVQSADNVSTTVIK